MVEPRTAAVFTPDSDFLGPEASLGFVTGCCQSVCVFFFKENISTFSSRFDSRQGAHRYRESLWQKGFKAPMRQKWSLQMKISLTVNTENWT